MKRKGLSTGMLKIIAVITMLLDHIGLIFFEIPSPLGYTGIGELFDVPLRAVGRFAFPVFLFCLIEGYFHTHDRKKYAVRIFLFAFLSELPYDFGIHGGLFVWNENNVMWTMFLVIVMCMFLDRVSGNSKTAVRIIIVCVFTAFAYIMRTDYAHAGIIAGAVMYFMHDRHVKGYILSIGALCLLLSPLEAFAFLSVPFIKLYDGRKGAGIKYFFYLFYPLHLIVLRILYIIIF